MLSVPSRVCVYVPVCVYFICIILDIIHPREMKMHMHAETCTQLFTAALFVITENGKQPKCPVAGKCSKIKVLPFALSMLLLQSQYDMYTLLYLKWIANKDLL